VNFQVLIETADSSGFGEQQRVVKGVEGLHRAAQCYKHAIYLKEGCQAARLTMSQLTAHHQSIHRGIAAAKLGTAQGTKRALALVETKFESTQLRLASLEKRMQNITSLVRSDFPLTIENPHSPKWLTLDSCFVLSAAKVFPSRHARLK
jgi:hypothetical protein